LVLFAVGGTINGGVELRSGCVYLAGQTAPGDGIQVIGLNGNVAFRVDRFDATSDVVVRYMRFRSTKGGAGAQDAVSVHGGARMMFDHLSVQFGNDEVFSVEPVATNGDSAADITISNTIIAAGLMPHSTGSLFMSPKSNESLSTSGLSLHRNLWSHNSHRNPAMGRLYDVQIVNNVMYNWKGNVGRMDRGTRADVIANTFLAGPWTTANGREDRIFQHDTLGALSSVYLEGNVARPYQPSPGGNQRVMVKYLAGGGLLPDEAYVEHRHAQPAVPLTVVGADQAATAILDEAGASRRLACDGSWVAARDPLDTRIVADVRAGTGPSQDSEMDHPSDLGGSPSLSAGTPCPDDDEDGMPNAYEARFEFDPLDAADASQDADGDGYLNIEEYLNGSEPR
ncbi:MAG: hypothetical protein HKO53_06645, partial [Gemmatimonadetes bacterium]|nr:hypothetical protein [Gemmatimonadota bacterium]